jgi:hypothetical protein
VSVEYTVTPEREADFLLAPAPARRPPHRHGPRDREPTPSPIRRPRADHLFPLQVVKGPGNTWINGASLIHALGCCLDRVWNRRIDPGKVFDLVLPLEQVADAYRAMDVRRAIKVLLRP